MTDLDPVRFHGRIVDSDGKAVGTCFQIDDGVLVTAHHVVRDVTAPVIGAHVYFEPLDNQFSVPRAAARVIAVDKFNDLAVLRTDHPLQASAPLMAYSDGQAPHSEFRLMGYATLPESEGRQAFRVLPTTGRWEGISQSEGGAKAVRAVSTGVEPGMRGSPVLRLEDGAVIGVLRARYNTNEVFSSGRVWIIRTEALEPASERSDCHRDRA
ncbi:S1 family peptidase [Kribbella speibonae]|nr:serine protease [Kribbella speibonae]